jgi:hypothetical protein
MGVSRELSWLWGPKRGRPTTEQLGVLRVQEARGDEAPDPAQFFKRAAWLNSLTASFTVLYKAAAHSGNGKRIPQRTRASIRRFGCNGRGRWPKAKPPALFWCWCWYLLYINITCFMPLRKLSAWCVIPTLLLLLKVLLLCYHIHKIYQRGRNQI